MSETLPHRKTTYKFRLFPYGEVQFIDERVSNPVTFAHVADLHLPPGNEDVWPTKYRQAINWWNIDSEYPHKVLPCLLDNIKAHGVDFVFFGGDILDCYHAETAELVVRLCRERNLPAYFQIGNHDWEDEYIRYVSHECEYDVRTVAGQKLCRDWNMPGLYYSFEHNGVRFIALDTPYVKALPLVDRNAYPLDKLKNGYQGIFDAVQADWFIKQLDYDGPIIIFHHVPFNRPTVEYRLRSVWQGILACIAEDENGRRILSAIERCPNVLGTFTAHSHFRSEDQFGSTCQFMAPPGCMGEWRYVKIADTTPPKSLRIPGEPVVVL